jgi:16S rRNA (adenine1518-N6/adenine1519-N6)-dimethyltransferase
LDRDLVSWLREKFAQWPQLTIHSGDALKFDFSTLSQNQQQLHVVGNLPYNISTPLLFHLLQMSHCIADMHFMLQKEVAERICATPGGKNYGKLSVMMQYHCQADVLFDIAAESFNPMPKVTSTLIRLIPHRCLPVSVDEVNDLNYVVTQAFSQRRKTLRNALKPLLNEAEIQAVGVDPNQRAENLSLDEFAQLSNLWTATVKKLPATI